MKLSEIAKGYRETEAVIREHLKILRATRRETKDPEERWRLKQRIQVWTQIYTQTREIAELCERYYDRGFWPDEKYRV